MGNEINIKAYVNIGGPSSSLEAWEEGNEKLRQLNNNFNLKSYCHLVIEGFKLWEGDYKINGEDVKVNVDVIHKNIHDKIPSKQRYLEIEIRSPSNSFLKSDYFDRAGQSHIKVNPFTGWSIQNPAKYMRLYTGYLRNGQIDYDDWGAFKAVVAHEFGHVLGISDAYDVSRERILGGRRAAPDVIIENDIKYEIPRDAIMRSGFRASNYVTDYDIKLMLQAFSSNTFQHYPEVDK